MSNTDSGHGPSEEGDRHNSVSTFSDPLAQRYRTCDSVRNSFKAQPPCYRSVCSSPCVIVEGCRPGDSIDPCRPFSRQFGRVGGCSNSKRAYSPEVSVLNGSNCSCDTDHRSVNINKLNHKRVNDSPYNDIVQRTLSVKFQYCDIGDSTSRADDTDTNVTDDDSSSCTSGSYTVGIEGDDAVSVSVDV